jgi:hypothetical protein
MAMLMKIVAIVLACSITGGLVGAGMGYLIGTRFPDIYRPAYRTEYRDAQGQRTVVPAERNPVHIGIGLGIPQGMMGGGILGVLISCIYAWHDARTRLPTNGLEPEPSE